MKNIYCMCIIIVWTVVICLLTAWMKWVEFANSKLDRETVSSFECGFDVKDHSRLPFSLRFFLMMILFMLFDVELCVLFQVPYEISWSCFENRLWYCVFLVLIVLGVFEENRRGALQWKK